jgi:hypothetical protein
VSTREEYIAGLRAVADLIEATPDLPLPSSELLFSWNVWPSMGVDDIPAEVARLRRLLPGTFTKNDPGSAYGAAYYQLDGQIGAAKLEITTNREEVCERVVTGTREVVKTVPAPGTPTVEVVETVEDFEWVCKPLLAEVTP